MEKLRSLFGFKSILHRMLASFLTIILLIVGIVLVSLYSSNQTNETASAIVTQEVPEILMIEEVYTNFNKRQQLAYEFIVTEDIDAYYEFRELKDANAILERELLKYNDSEEVAITLEKAKDWTEKVDSGVMNQVIAGNISTAEANITLYKPQANQIVNTYTSLTDQVEEDVQNYGVILEETQTRSMTVVVALGVVATILAIVIALLTTRSITVPVKEMKNRLESISESDLSSPPLDISSKDELGQLGVALNKTQENLINLIENVQIASNNLNISSQELYTTGKEVGDGTNQIAATMQQLASGSELQANSASNLAQEMDKFSHTTRETLNYGQDISTSSTGIVEMAEQGNDLMDKSNEQMRTVNEVVQQAVSQMAVLNQEAVEISKLVDYINKIAKQTNLLALNASIEAARAGEHGKGFAVVADEVRELAETVAQSVSYITNYVNSIQSEAEKVTHSLESVSSDVNVGTKQIEATGETLSEITASISDLQAKNQQMANNLNDISTKSIEMNRLIDDIASISEESAAGVEETSASVEEINSSIEEVTGQSEKLVDVTRRLNEVIENVKL